MKLVLLHTNDVHGNVEGLARVATLVERIRAETDAPVFYLDAGDVEETTTRISNVTKGAAMHRLLSAAGCDAATVGNAAWLRYGTQVVPDHARAASYPLLLANLQPVEGVQPAALLERDGVRVGVVGVTAPMMSFFEGIDFGLEALEVLPLVREHARALRDQGAALVVVLSHLGLEEPREGVDDRRLARELEGEIDLVIGAHTHDVLPKGERVGSVLICQAGEQAQYLGRVDVGEDGLAASLIPVAEDVPVSEAVLAAAERATVGVDHLLAEPLGELPEGVDAEWVAEVLRQRMHADVAILCPGQALTHPLRPGSLRRGELWDACDSSANPGVAELTGAQLLAVIERGRDPGVAASTDRPLRGRPRGELVVAGRGVAEIDAGATYRVAGTDWELEPYGGYVQEEWNLRIRYDFPTILREAIEEHLLAAR